VAVSPVLGDPLELDDLATALTTAAAAFGPRLQLADATTAWTFDEHLERARALASALQAEHGVEPGDRVACIMRNLPEFSLAFWAAQLAGAVFVPVNARLAAPEVERVLTHADPRVVIADRERAAVATEWAGATVGVLRIDEGAGSLDAAVTAHRGRLPRPAPRQQDDPATILFTSGTTGTPKGIVHSHRNHLATLHSAWAEAAATSADVPDGERSAQLATMPLFHITQLSTLYLCLYRGAALHLMWKWDAREAARIIDDHAITDVSGVPMQIEALLDERLRGADLGSLRRIGVGATIVPQRLVSRIWSEFDGAVQPATGYGMTESTSSVTSISGVEYVEHPHSVGRAHDIDAVRTVDADGAPVPAGVLGEIQIAGPNVTFDRWDGRAVRRIDAPDGWLSTGDVGRLDGEGRLTVVDRIKDVIIRGGENVYSSEVEHAIREDPGVRDVAVISAPHPVWGEEVVAVLVPRDTAFDPEALRAHLSGRLGAYKIPTRIRLVDKLPRTPSGKVRKSELRETLGTADHF
jgi:long-chain acyl-CoA synthetase